jgi:hypothetical protein
MPHDVAAASLAECDACWNALGTLTKAQRRWRERERELRINVAAQGGQVPEAGDPIIEEIRSGRWEKRQRKNMRNLRRDRAKLAMWKREGYSFDAEHRLVASPEIHAPARRESATRPREHRSRSRTRPARGSSDDPDLEEPPPAAFVRGFTAASERLSRHLQRRTAARRLA